MADGPQTESIQTATSYSAIGFGAVATLMPRLFTALYGLGDDPRLRVIVRLWGTRTAVLGAALLTADSESDKRRLMTLATAMNVADAALALTAGDDVPARSRILGSLTSASFAAIGAYALANSQ